MYEYIPLKTIPLGNLNSSCWAGLVATRLKQHLRELYKMTQNMTYLQAKKRTMCVPKDYITVEQLMILAVNSEVIAIRK